MTPPATHIEVEITIGSLTTWELFRKDRTGTRAAEKYLSDVERKRANHDYYLIQANLGKAKQGQNKYLELLKNCKKNTREKYQAAFDKYDTEVKTLTASFNKITKPSEMNIRVMHITPDANYDKHIL